MRHLRPSNRPHASQKGTHQHTAQAQQNADFKMQAGQARGDQAHAVNLRHHVGKRTQNRCACRNAARPAPAKAQRKIVGQGVEIEAAQVGRHQQGHQAKAAGPAQHIGQAPRLVANARKALQVQAAGQADERRRTHPVGSSGHAVVHGRYAPPGDVIFLRVGGAAIDPDTGVQHQGDRQKDTGNPDLGQARLLRQAQANQANQQDRHIGAKAAVDAAGVSGQRGRNFRA